MDIRISTIKSIQLEFGSPASFSDPKEGLIEAGPFDMRFGPAQLKEVKIGIIGSTDILPSAQEWLKRCRIDIPTTMKNFKQYPDFKGFEEIFRARLVTNDIWVHQIEVQQIETAVCIRDPQERFEKVLELYNEGLERLANLENNKPNVILCAISDAVVEACHHVERKLSQEEKDAFRLAAQKNRPTSQLSLLFPESIEETEEDLLYRDFRRALKAKAILSKIPIQIGTRNLFVDSSDNQEPATRAWNFSVAVYYKAGGIPWRLKNETLDTCFVGITFHHLRTNQRAVVKSCLAQAFSSNGEGFALRGADIPHNPTNPRLVHLSYKQASELGQKILDEYAYRTGVTPQRVVLHKTSMFNEEEESGFRNAFANIPVVELINILPTSFRFLKHNNYPVERGTLCIVNDSKYYLFTTGFIREIGTYPGPHIPRPVELRSNSDMDIEMVARDILGLAKMNWNTSSITGGEPVTLFFSRQVGGIMAELSVNNITEIPTSFRYYI